MKIVVNACFGGFGLSKKALEMLGEQYDFEFEPQEHRTDARLISVVESLGDEANGMCAKLRIATIPDNATDWMIDNYDGMERIIYVLNGKLNFARAR